MGNYSIACGEGCIAQRANNIAIGKNCYVGYKNGFSIGIGRDCRAQKDNIAMGDNVNAEYPGGAENYGGTIAIGKNISAGGVVYGYTISGGYNKGAVLVGHDLQTQNWSVYSNAETQAYYFGASPAVDSFSPSSLKIGIGNNITALESDKDGLLRFPHGFCMDSITTTVNTIVAPSDPSNPTTDEQTLATKAYVDSSISADLPMKHLANALTGLDETSFPMDFTSYWTAARASDSNMKISLRINGSCYSKSLYNCLAVDGAFECYRSAYDSGTQVTTFYRYRFGWDYQNKTLSLSGSMSWDMHDVGVVDNVNHGLTGLTITIYQIETY